MVDLFIYLAYLCIYLFISSLIDTFCWQDYKCFLHTVRYYMPSGVPGCVFEASTL